MRASVDVFDMSVLHGPVARTRLEPPTIPPAIAMQPFSRCRAFGDLSKQQVLSLRINQQTHLNLVLVMEPLVGNLTAVAGKWNNASPFKLVAAKLLNLMIRHKGAHLCPRQISGLAQNVCFHLLSFQCLTRAVSNGVDPNGIWGFRHPQFHLHSIGLFRESGTASLGTNAYHMAPLTTDRFQAYTSRRNITVASTPRRT